MARKLRSNNPVFPHEIPVAQARVYKAIAYVRLSVEDSGKGTSDSIENQKAMILDYIELQPDMELSALYCDNGATGTDFDRPGFEQLMQDIKSGLADCVVVKDLSRFGRNYIETGNYLERVFPFLGVRFVSVTDCFDTLSAQRSEDGYIIPLKNLINHIYAKDISRKVGTALALKQQKGEFIGCRPSYGYRKDPKNKNHLIVDEVAAPVVKDIFQWYATGVTIMEIIEKLDGANIPSPSQHHHALGIVKSDKFLQSKWCDKTIRGMLTHEVYRGHLVQGRARKSLFEGLPRTKIERDNWTVVPNTHDAIVSEEIYEAVQARMQAAKAFFAEKKKRVAPAGSSENILQGLIFCDECGAPFHRHKCVRINKVAIPQYRIWYQYYCSTHSKNTKNCSVTSLHADVLFDAIFATLQAQISSVLDIKKLLSMLQNHSIYKQKKSFYQIEKAKLQGKLNGVTQYSKGMFESYYAGVITEQDFIALSASYEKEREEIKEKIERITKSEKSSLDSYNPHSAWLSAFEQFQNETTLTREMAMTLVEKIEVAQDKTITITLKYRDEYMAACKILTEQVVMCI